MIPKRIDYSERDRDWLEREKARIEDALEDLKPVSARKIIGKYDENWQGKGKGSEKDMYIHVSELKVIAKKLQNSRITSLAEDERDNIIMDVVQRICKAMASTKDCKGA